MKILLLILASTGSEYAGFEALWRRYMHSHPDIHAYFYKGNPELDTEAVLEGDTLWVKCSDGLEAVYEKLMRALRFFAPDLDLYTFVFRTNLSSFIDFKIFIPFCTTLPETECYAGVQARHMDLEIDFVSGAGFLLSTDLVDRLVKENPPEVVLDDVSVGAALTSWGVPILRANRIDVRPDQTFRYEHPLGPDEVIFHYRVKTEDRARDVATLTQVADLCGTFDEHPELIDGNVH